MSSARAPTGLAGTVSQSVWLSEVNRPPTFAGNGLDSEARSALLAHGGRLYLTRSPWASPEVTAEMYPRAKEVLALKERLDPDGRLASDATRRLFGA